MSGPDCSRFDFDFDADVDPACRPDARLPPHALGASLRFGICTLTCEPGWFDCNHETFDGCESTSCTDPLLEAGGPWAHTLSDAPLGLARCGDEVVFLEGNAVLAASTIDMSVRTVALLDLAPAGGVACANGFAVLPLRRSMEGGVDGRISRFRLNDAGSDAAPIDLERLVDPARSIDVDDAGGVFWIARTDAGPFVMQSALDASAMPLLPVDEPIIYKTFALHNNL